LVFAPGFIRSPSRTLFKRLVDIIGAVMIGVLSLPISVIAAIAIKLESPGPVLYSQDRVGLRNRVFRVYKFRSMRDGAEESTGPVWAAQNDPRATHVGRILRRLRLDELPQLFNVLRGDMSLVGPRPERPELVRELAQALPLYDYRHCVRPGLTGWAQISSPYGASVEDSREKLSFDVYYVKNWSLAFDLQIMIETFKVMMLGRGAR
jgi:exopolysaccharide biosynthesis polyprenyl glycosylphosphotransferase